MTDRIAATAVQLHARLAGALYLAVILTGIFGFYAGSALIVRGDAAATAHNIMASELLFRMSAVADLIAGICYVGVTAILYELLKPVNRTLSLAAAFFSLMGIAAGASGTANRLTPAGILGNAHAFGAFGGDQLNALAFAPLKTYGVNGSVGILFFGLYCVLIGWLIVRSTFIPRLVGALMIVAGAAYLLNSFAVLLSPPFAARLPDFTLLLGLLGEGALTFWLLVFGVNEARWREQSGAAA